MKKILALSMVFVLMFLTSCGGKVEQTTTESENPNRISIFFADMDNYELKEMRFNCRDLTDISCSIEDISGQMFAETSINSEYFEAMPDYFIYKTCSLSEDGRCLIDMDLSGQEADAAGLVLWKAAIVKSFCQIPHIKRVTFVINDLGKPEGEQISEETYRAEDFVIATSSDSYVQRGVIVLYFATEDCSALKRYDKAVDISNTVSLEQVVIESLLEGPLREGYSPTIPEKTVLNRISVKDGCAYVNFSSEFAGAREGVSSELTVYSVVNSLIELPTINRVQLLIDGERVDLYRETIDISNALEKNADLISPETE
ncbi:MAG: GerMN domain-containing protein [Lachnospiraceae bacterium]|nr:GerMN domain-containing protein [Lachnospiraceae bacterium]